MPCVSNHSNYPVSKYYTKKQQLLSKIQFTIENNQYDRVNLLMLLSKNKSLLNHTFGCKRNSILHLLLKNYKGTNLIVFEYIIKFLIENVSFDGLYMYKNLDSKKAIDLCRNTECLNRFYMILKNSEVRKSVYELDYLKYCRNYSRNVWGLKPDQFTFYTHRSF